jgi:Co/Zn/Cd efflux system component
MNIIEFACFVGLPSVVAFVFLFGVQKHFQFSIGIGFGSAIISLLVVVLFSFFYRLVRGRHIQKNAVLVWAVLALLISASMAIFIRMHHGFDQAEDRRSWLRGIDAENAKAGFVRDTNGALIYVGATNNLSKPH